MTPRTPYKVKAQLFICLLFMASGAVNNGSTQFLCSLPFAVAFIMLIRKLPKIDMCIWLSVTFIALFILGWNHRSNTLLYPKIGKVFTLSCNWGYVRYPYSFTGHAYYTLIPPSLTKPSAGRRLLDYIKSDEIIEPYTKLPCQLQLTLIRVEIDNADFGRRYEPVFENTEGERFLVWGQDVDDAIKTRLIYGEGVNKPNDLQSSWTDMLSNLMYWPILPHILFRQL